MDVALDDRLTGRIVPASLIDRIDVAYAQHVDDLWLTYLAAEVAKATAAGAPLGVPEHAHWNWTRKVQATAHLLPYPTLAIECEGQAQGLMMLKTDGEVARLPGEQGKALVYVVFLASAPWNLPSIVPHPRFRGVGTVMMRTAIETSIDLGFKGRVGLHSLPQSEVFYARMGMTTLGNDPNKENLNYFEMAPEQAMAFIR
jgi:hypothetical protein